MDLLIDSNIVIDVVGRRQPFYQSSRLVCLLGLAGEANTFITTAMMSDIIYILGKDYGSMEAQRLAGEKLSFLKVCSAIPEDYHNAIAARWNDFEDCFVSQCASRIRADYIVTRNTKDFTQSVVPAITPDDLLAKLENSLSITYREVVLEG